MDVRGPKNPQPVGLPDPDEPDDLLWVDTELDDVLVDEWPTPPISAPTDRASGPRPAPSPAPATPTPPARVVPPAELISESSAADWIGAAAPAPAAKPTVAAERRPIIEPVDPPVDGESALEALVGVPLPPLPASSRKGSSARRPGPTFDIALRYEARLRISGLTGDAFVAARVATNPPATLKAAVVRFGRGADPELSPIQPIAGPDETENSGKSHSGTGRFTTDR